MRDDMVEELGQVMRGHQLRPPGQFVDILAILSAQSIGWYGPFSTVPVPPLEGDHDVAESEQSDRLAS